MIRIDSISAEKIYFYLAWILINHGGSFEGILRDVAQAVTSGPDRFPKAYATLVNILNRLEDSTGQVDDLMAPLSEQILAEYRGEGDNAIDGELIEDLAGILQGSLSRNRLNYKTLQLLRKAILLPTEQSAARYAMKRDLKCVKCNGEFTSNEMVTLTREPDESGQHTVVALYCAKCMVPRSVSCAQCAASMRLSESDLEKLKKMISKNCGCHKDGKERVTEVPQIIDETLAFGAEPAADINNIDIVWNSLRDNNILAPPAGAPRAFRTHIERPEHTPPLRRHP